jgi:hypothetical protein
MGLSDDIKNINADLDKLRKELGKTPLKPFDEKDIDKAREALGGLRTELREMSSDLDYVSKSFKDSVNELSRQNTFLTDARNSLKGIASLSDKILEYRRGETTLSEKQLKNLQQQAKTKFDSLKNDLRSGQLSKANAEEVKNALDQQQLFDEEVQRTIDHQKAVNKEIGLLGTGLSGAAKILSKMGFGDLSQPLQDAIDKTKNARLQQKLNNDELSSTQSQIDDIIKKEGFILSEKQLQAGFGGKELKDLVNKKKSLESQNKSLDSQTSKYKNIGKALKDQLTSVNLIDLAFVKLIEAFGISQKGIGDLAKGLGMSSSRATEMRQDFAYIANSSMDANVSVKGLQEAQLAVGQALGTNAQLNESDLVTLTKITKQTGLQHDELIGIEKLSLSQGKSLDSNLKSALGGATAFASQNKLVVNNNKVLQEVNKASGSLKLSLGGSTEALGKAVVQTQKMGINLETASSMAQSLLDFESSIENELSAELLTGKNLNLEKARQLSLEGDIAGAAEEVLKQVKGTEEFSKMNVLQQESMAKAVGMTRDQLADSLIEREALAAMSAEEGETALQAYNKLKESGATEDEIIKKLGDKAAKQLEQQSSQEKFNNALEKAQEIFVQIMDALAPIFDVLSSIATTILPAINFILQPIIMVFQSLGDSIQGIKDLLTGNIEPTFENIVGNALKLVGAITGLVSLFKVYKAIQAGILIQKQASLTLEARGAAMSKGAAIMSIIKGAWSSSGMIPFIGAGLAIAAIAGGIALVNSQKMKDGMIGPGGEMVVSGPKGSIQLDKDDSIVAGTDLFGGNKKSNQQSTPTQSSPTSVNVDMGPTNALLQQLINVISAGGDIMIDGQKVGQALNLVAYKTQ